MGNFQEFFDLTQKYKPQGNALAGGIMVLLVSGMQIGWIFDNQIHKLPWSEGRDSILIQVAFITFYVSGIVGLFAASTVISRLTKSNIYVSFCGHVLMNFCVTTIELQFNFPFQYSSLIFITAGSGILIGVPNNIFTVIVSRFMIGFAHGYAYLTALVHASEIVHQKLRGMIVSAFQLCLMCSAIMTSTFTTTMGEENLSPFQWIGIVGLLYTVLGIVIAIFVTRESPVQLMQQKRFDAALSIMVKVRNESSETWSIRNEYNELKAMVEEDTETSDDIFNDGNFRPLMLITLLKVAFVVSFNYGLNMIRLRYSSAFITSEGYNFTTLAWLTIRLFAYLFTIFSIELKGRKFHFLISHVGASVLLIILGIAAFTVSNVSLAYEVMQIIYEIIAGLGMGVIADVYSSEAFNTLKKARSIFVVTSIEFLLHIAIIFATFNVTPSALYDGIFFIASGAVLCAVTYILFKELPETAKMSIRQTRNEFLKQGEIVFSGSNKSEPRSITFSN
jgi:hypothetical protein